MGDIEGYDILFRTGYIGHGSYGSVYKAKNKETGEIAALKRIIISSADFENRLHSVKNEIKYIKQLGDHHRNILKLLKTKEEEDGPNLYVSILTEYCNLNDLEKYASTYFLTTEHRLKILQEAASGLAFMHGQNPPVIHRDVKPSNILMTKENGEHVVKLADFGLARPIEGSRSFETMTNAGTESYMAPEQFDETHFWFKLKAHFHKSGAQDAFSFGIVAYQVIESQPLNGIACPEVTKHIIGKMMMRIGEVEAEVDKSRKEREESMSWLAKKMESQEARDAKDSKRREDIWALKNLTKINDVKPTKHWNPIVIKESDTRTIKATKDIIQSVVQFDPRERITMAEVERRLKEIIRALPYKPPGVPVFVSMFTTQVPEIHEVARHPLKFATSNKMVLSKTFIAENLDNNKIVIVSTNETGGKTKSEKPRPTEIKANSDVYLLADGNIVFRHWNHNITVVCNNDLIPIDSHTGDFGRLCGVVQGNKLLYCKYSNGRHVISLYRYDDKLHQPISALPLAISSDGINTATHPATGWFVLTDCRAKTMDIFQSDLQHHTRVPLKFQPGGPNGVCCLGDLIAVARRDGKGVMLFNWSGDLVHDLETRKMSLKDKTIQGVGDHGDGKMLVFTCDRCLHVYKVF